MKSKFNKMWLLVSITIVINIIIFSFMSNNLESYVESSIVSKIDTSDW